jgi:hypothetical protein
MRGIVSLGNFFLRKGAKVQSRKELLNVSSQYFGDSNFRSLNLGNLSKNRGKFPKFESGDSKNAQDSNFGNFSPQSAEMIRILGIFRTAQCKLRKFAPVF